MFANKNPLANFEDEELNHKEKVLKQEEEMEEVFKSKVKQKTWKMEATETDFELSVVKEKQELAEEREDLFYRREDFEREKSAWESKNGSSSPVGSHRSAESLGRKNKFGFRLGSFKIGKV